MGVDDPGLVRSAAAPTATKTRILAQGFTGGLHGRQQVLRLDQHGADRRAAARRHAPTRVAGWRRLRRDAAVRTIAAAWSATATIAAARASGRPIAVDSQGDVRRFRGVRPAEDQSGRGAAPRSATTTCVGGGDDAAPRARRTCAGDHAGRRRHARVRRRGGARCHVPAVRATEVFDVTGAGDTVIAVLTLGLIAGLPHSPRGRTGQRRGERRGPPARRGGGDPRGDRRRARSAAAEAVSARGGARLARRAQAPAGRLRLQAALLLVDRRRRRVLQTDHVVQHRATLVLLAVADPALPIKRARHLEPMPVRVIGNDRRIVFARARNGVNPAFRSGFYRPTALPPLACRRQAVVAQFQDGVGRARGTGTSTPAGRRPGGPARRSARRARCACPRSKSRAIEAFIVARRAERVLLGPGSAVEQIVATRARRPRATSSSNCVGQRARLGQLADRPIGARHTAVSGRHRDQHRRLFPQRAADPSGTRGGDARAFAARVDDPLDRGRGRTR